MLYSYGGGYTNLYILLRGNINKQMPFRRHFGGGGCQGPSISP